MRKECRGAKGVKNSGALRKFYCHLARILYAEVTGSVFWTFGEIRAYLERERELLYLDGPNDVDFIMRNRVLREREEAMYVDFVTQDGAHTWVTPKIYELVGGGPGLFDPPAVELVSSMERAGFADPEALRIVASRWRRAPVSDDTDLDAIRHRNLETLRDLDRAGILRELPEEEYARIVECWTYPLYCLELAKQRVDETRLQDTQGESGSCF